MDIQVDITDDFDKSYKKIPQPKRKLIGDKINQLVVNLQNGNKRSLIRPRGIEFPANIKKSQSTISWLTKCKFIVLVSFKFFIHIIVADIITVLYELLSKYIIGFII